MEETHWKKLNVAKKSPSLSSIETTIVVLLTGSMVVMLRVIHRRVRYFDFACPHHSHWLCLSLGMSSTILRYRLLSHIISFIIANNLNCNSLVTKSKFVFPIWDKLTQLSTRSEKIPDGETRQLVEHQVLTYEKTRVITHI